MKKYIEIVDFDPGVGNEYTRQMYPSGSGIYYIARLNTLHLVSDTGIITMMCVGRLSCEVELKNEADASAAAALLAVALHRDAAVRYIEQLTNPL